ncbi:hypothetical protein [Janibacter sp. GXQ6167]|uniref:hypothetical protein n=1 Tax=Janibacter sp. GXQ6167 TaxID=3240791 RepID=UPI003523663F
MPEHSSGQPSEYDPQPTFPTLAQQQQVAARESSAARGEPEPPWGVAYDGARMSRERR